MARIWPGKNFFLAWNDLQMALPGTLWRNAGPTYYAENAANSTTTPDHWLVPRELLGSIRKNMVLKRAAKELQLIPDKRHRDHLPVLLSFEYKLELDKTVDGRTLWDQDKISL